MPRTRATQPAGAAAVIESATYVVAASDSQDPTRADALYRCDGVADEVGINAAIAALPATGGIVCLLEGTYNTAATITIGRDDVTLRGVGYGSIIEPQGDFHAIEVTADHHHILIENLQVDGVNTTAVVYGIYLHGLTGEEITESKVENCWVHGFDGVVTARGITLVYCHHCIVTRNYVTGNGYGIFVDDCYHIAVHSNHINSNTRNGINLSHSSYTTIVGNDVYSNANYGIFVDELSHFCLVESNTIRMNGVDGLSVRECHNIIIIGNIIMENSWGTINIDSGILLDDSDDVVIIGNNISIRHRYGINISNATCDRAIVKNNCLLGNVTGCINDLGTGTKLAEIHVNSIFDTSDTNVTLANIGDHVALSMPNAQDTTIRFNFKVPSDFQELVRARLVVVPAAGGNLRRAVATDWGACGEAYNANTDDIAASTVIGLTLNQLECLDLDDAFTGIAAGDHVGVAFNRDATHEEDTIEDVVYVLEFWMQYV